MQLRNGKSVAFKSNKVSKFINKPVIKHPPIKEYVNKPINKRIINKRINERLNKDSDVKSFKMTLRSYRTVGSTEQKVIEPKVIESKVIEPKVIEPKVVEPKVKNPDKNWIMKSIDYYLNLIANQRLKNNEVIKKIKNSPDYYYRYNTLNTAYENEWRLWNELNYIITQYLDPVSFTDSLQLFRNIVTTLTDLYIKNIGNLDKIIVYYNEPFYKNSKISMQETITYLDSIAKH
jgi:hypothetical protein